jgi:hypothetical protein
MFLYWPRSFGGRVIKFFNKEVYGGICRKINRYRLRKFRGAHAGRRCVVVGNGPSIGEMNLSKLKGEVTIGCNRIYLTSAVVPKYYCIEDALLLRQISGDLKDWEADETVKFVPADLSGCLRGVKDVYPINFVAEDFEGRGPNFSEDFSRVCYWGSTVSYVMLQLAYYLGCNPIYLIGMDGVRGGKPKHFYKKDDVEENNARYELSDAAFIEAREFLASEGVKVFDATRDPVRSFFERVDYEEVFV